MRRLAASIALVAATVLGAPGAAGHLALPKLAATRAITITLGDAASLDYGVALGPHASDAARREADVDRDGEVSTEEGNALVDRWTARLSSDVRIAMGRSPLPEARPLGALPLLSIEAHGLGDAGSGAQVDVHWRYALQMDDAADRLRIDDALAIAPFEMTDVTVRDAREQPLIGVGTEEARLSSAAQMSIVDFMWSAPRSIWVVWRAKPRKALPLAWIGIGIGLALATAIGLAIATRRREA